MKKTFLYIAAGGALAAAIGIAALRGAFNGAAHTPESPPPAPESFQIQDRLEARALPRRLKFGKAIAGAARAAPDGDTLRLDSGGTVYKIRLWGADAPERDQTCRQGERQISCGAMAANTLNAVIAGKELSCRPRGGEKGISHDRVVALCTVGGVDVARIMVRSGAAFDDAGESRGYYKPDEDAARGEKRGLWSMDAASPEVWRTCQSLVTRPVSMPKECLDLGFKPKGP